MILATESSTMNSVINQSAMVCMREFSKRKFTALLLAGLVGQAWLSFGACETSALHLAAKSHSSGTSDELFFDWLSIIIIVGLTALEIPRDCLQFFRKLKSSSIDFSFSFSLKINFLLLSFFHSFPLHCCFRKFHNSRARNEWDSIYT